MKNLTKDSERELSRRIYVDDIHRLRMEDAAGWQWSFEKYILARVAPYYDYTKEQAEHLRETWKKVKEDLERIPE